jgi:hypothetical protein
MFEPPEKKNKKEIAMIPVILPSVFELNNLQKDRKQKKIFNTQAILYGVDMLQQESQYFNSLPKKS